MAFPKCFFEWNEILFSCIFSPGGAILLDDFCFSCLIRRPLRSKHCATCDRCVARFDHHCPWINNCVAIDNLKYFMGYLLFLGISLCWDMHGNVLLAVSKLSLMTLVARWSVETFGGMYAVDAKFPVSRFPSCPSTNPLWNGTAEFGPLSNFAPL